MKNISIYPRAWEIESADTIPFDIFLDNIRTGQWQDVYFKVSVIEDKKTRDALKKKIAASVTLSGLFSSRYDDKIIDHSGFIGIDIDEDGLPKGMNADELKALLMADKYVYAIFRSISGRGLCVIFRINGDKHREAFAGISEYLFTHYKQTIVDSSGINPSRARFVSYDPHIYVAQNTVPKFTDYPKPKEPKKYKPVVYAADDFHDILNQIVTSQLVIDKGDYHIWIKIAFSIISKFGEGGRQHFHTVSQYSVQYDHDVCDKQYTACMVAHERNVASKTNTANISTFYYFAKEAGCSVYSERTKLIAFAANQGKKSGLSTKDIVRNLDRFENISGTDVAPIVEQVLKDKIEIEDETIIDQLEMYIRQNYQLKRNEITRYIENNGVVMQQKDFNTVFLKAKKVLPKLSYELIDRLINSDFIPSYNPFLEYFRSMGALVDNVSHDNVANPTTPTETHQPGHIPDTMTTPPSLPHSSISSPGAIMATLGAIPDIPRPGTPEFAAMYPTIVAFFHTVECTNPEYLLYFGTKWMCGVISSIYGQHSPLYLALGGEKQGTGKTEFFRRMLPKPLKRYYGESKLDAGKDDEILMCQKLILVDDESSGKSKRENGKIKDLTSKEIFSLREPYGRNNVDLVRLASLGATTNIPESVLNDPTGNRRFITINVLGINHKAYNRVDKNELWCEVFRLYRSGFDWEVRPEENAYLNMDSVTFQMNTSEADLIMQYFSPTGNNELTPTEIKVYLEKHSQQRLSATKLGLELKRLGYEQKHIKLGRNVTKRVWVVGYNFGFVEPSSPRAIDGWKPPVAGDDGVPF